MTEVSKRSKTFVLQDVAFIEDGLALINSVVIKRKQSELTCVIH